MRVRAFQCLFSIVVLLSACTTTLTSIPVGLTPLDDSSGGLVYRIPAKQFTVTGAFTVTGCTATDKGADLKAKVTATYTESLVGDTAYRLDYSQLSGTTKVSNATITVSDSTGLITGINSVVTDTTGTVIQNTVTAAASVARAVALPGAIVPQAVIEKAQVLSQTRDPNKSIDLAKTFIGLESYGLLGDRVKGVVDVKKSQTERKANAVNLLICGKVIKSLKTIEKTQKALAEEQANDKARSGARTLNAQYQARVEYLKTYVEAYSDLGYEKEKAALQKEINVNKKLADDQSAVLTKLGDSKVAQLTKDLDDAKAKLVISKTEAFIPKLLAVDADSKVADANKDKSVATDGHRKETAGTTTDTPLAHPDAVSMESPSIFKVIELSKEDLADILGDDINRDVITSPKVAIVVTPMGVSIERVIKSSTKDIGIVYRVPKTSEVRLYSLYPSLGSDNCQEPPLPNIPALVTCRWNIFASNITQVPQYGPIASLNLKNQIFDDNLLDVVFGSSGGPIKVTFNSKSQAQAASSALKDATGSYLQLQKDKRQDKVDAINTNIDLATKQATLAGTLESNALTRAQNKNLIAQDDATAAAAIIKAQQDTLKEQQRLDAIRTGTATSSEVQLQSLKNQEDVLTEQLAILKLQAQISEAENKIKAGSGNSGN